MKIEELKEKAKKVPKNGYLEIPPQHLDFYNTLVASGEWGFGEYDKNRGVYNIKRFRETTKQ